MHPIPSKCPYTYMRKIFFSFFTVYPEQKIPGNDYLSCIPLPIVSLGSADREKTTDLFIKPLGTERPI